MWCYSSVLTVIGTLSKCDEKLFQISEDNHMGCCKAAQAGKAVKRGIQVASGAYLCEKYLKKTWDAIDIEGAQTVHEVANASREVVKATKNAVASAAKNLPKNPS